MENQLHSSPRCKGIFGFPPDAAFQYDDFLSCIHPSERDVVDAVVQRALHPDGDGEYEYEFRVIHPHGNLRWIFAKGKAFFENRDGRVVAIRFIGTVLDRTERKRAHEALIEAERLAIIGRLAASIAHEIRNPLETVTNLLYLIEGEDLALTRSKYLLQAREELARVSEIATGEIRWVSRSLILAN